jgi:GDP-4-dehydro-6-deoxy-D-mannose reductase
MSMRILLTGATGFVGPRLLQAIKEKFPSAEVLSWARHCEKAPECLSHHIDICSMGEVSASVKSFAPTHVVHLAAQSHVPTSFKDPLGTWNVNVMGSLHLFEALRIHTPAAAVVYVSSSEVYGRTFQSGAPMDESAQFQPQNPYAASKAATDIMAGQYAEQGMKILRFRPFNHIGPGQSHDFAASAFAEQIARIEAGLQTPILHVGNLEAQRDFLDVDDVIRAYTLALEKIQDLPTGLAMNLCSGQPRKIREILDLLLAQTDCVIQEEIDPSRMRPSDTPCAIGLAQKAQQYLGWSPRIPLQQTLANLLDDWRKRIREREDGQDARQSSVTLKNS